MESNEKLKQYVSRIERLNAEKKALQEDLKLVYQEAANDGYDKKALRQLIKLRAMNESERIAQTEIVDLYLSVVGV